MKNLTAEQYYEQVAEAMRDAHAPREVYLTRSQRHVLEMAIMFYQVELQERMRDLDPRDLPHDELEEEHRNLVQAADALDAAFRN